MKIGITERGDAGWDLSWHQILKNDTTYDGAVLITKYVTDTFIEKVMDLYNNGYPLIVHSTTQDGAVQRSSRVSMIIMCSLRTHKSC